MDTTQIANVLGFVAAGIGVVMFVPQAYRVYKTKNTKSISLLTFVLSIGTSVCWIIYALLLSAMPILFVNSVVTALSLYIVAMKLRYK